MKPYFSIVIPTKDRPECIEIILKSIQRQGFQDYEVVVSDNGFARPCLETAKAAGDDRIRYFSTGRPLGMSDSFEQAIAHASGRWVMLLGDKNILYPSSLEKLYKTTMRYDPEIVNYSQERLKPFDIERDLVCGKLLKREKKGGVRWINPLDAIAGHLTCHQMFDMTDDLWNMGCVYGGGVYRESFLSELRLSHDSGRVFDGIVPDRYGAVDALCIAKKVLFLDDEISIYDNCGRHDWASTQKKGMEQINSFVRKSRGDRDYTDALLIPGVTASMNNILASDYLNAARNGTSPGEYEALKQNVDMGQLLVKVECDLRDGQDLSDEVRDEQLVIFNEYVEHLSASDREGYIESKRKMKKKGAEHKAIALFGLRPFLDRWIGKGVLSSGKALRGVCTMLENALSRDIVVVRGLSDIV